METTKTIQLGGFSYNCIIGYEPKQKVDSERDLADVPGHVYLESAYCVEEAADVKEGKVFDSLERELWKLAKKGEL